MLTSLTQQLLMAVFWPNKQINSINPINLIELNQQKWMIFKQKWATLKRSAW